MVRDRTKSLPRRHKKKIILLVTVLALVALRLYLPVLALKYVNKELNKDPEYRGAIEEVRLHLWRGAYSALNLKIERVEGQHAFPFLAIKRINIGLSWRDLFKGSVVAKIEFVSPMINFVAEKVDDEQKVSKKVAVGGDTKAEKKKEISTWHQVFKNLVPLDISRLEIVDGSIHFRDLTSNPKIDVFLDQLAAIGVNLTNSSRVSKTLFGHVDLHARAMTSGTLKIVLLINPVKDPLEAKVTINLSGLALTNLNELFTAYGKFDVKRGRFDFYSEIAVAQNEVKGYVKPLIHDLEVSEFKQDVKKGLIHAIWEKIVGAAGFLLKNHPKNQQGLEAHFEGRLDKPDVKVWDTIVSIFQNIFIQALPKGTDNSVKLKDVKK